MKRARGGSVWIALLFAALLLGVGIAPIGRPVAAEAAGSYFSIPSYRAEFTIGNNRTVRVVETISVRFLVPQHGIIRDFALDGRIRYRDISVKRDGAAVPARYRSDDSALFSLAIGDGDTLLSTDRDYVYEISYTEIVPALKDRGLLPLDVLGYDWHAPIERVSVSVALPEGLETKEIFSGSANTKENLRGVACEQTGDALLLTAENFGYGGITLDLHFSAGALKAPPADLTPLWAAILVLGLIGAALLIKCTVCRQPVLTRTVNFSAPESMDPLKMGKIIDNKVDSEDLGALVFWFAAEGYLRIDLSEDKEDPVLIKTEKSLPPDAPAHQRVFYEGLFCARERVRTSELKNSFYRTANAAKASVDAATDKMYAPKGKVFLAVLAVLTALLCGAFALFYNLAVMGYGYLYFQQFIVSLLCFAPSAAFSSIAEQRRYKWSKPKRFFAILGGLLLCCIPSLLSLLPSAALSLGAHLILSFGAAVSGALAGTFFVRTQRYCDQLGQILGFKDFILYTEKEKLGVMLREDPELYYSVLPYAQVLGVTDVWTEKFEGLDLAPPKFLNYNGGDFLFTAIAWHAVFRPLNSGMSRTMISRPTTTGARGGRFGGGHFGGFGGGGFGGGGGRSF